MKKRIWIGILMLILLGSLFMPFFTVYPHMALDRQVAAAFPGDVSGLALITKGNGILPLSLMPALGSVPFRQELLAIGVALTLLGGFAALSRRRLFPQVAMLLGGAGLTVTLLFSFYFQQLGQSILFHVFLTVKWYLWVPFVVSLLLFLTETLQLRTSEHTRIHVQSWRRLSAILSVLALLTLLLPFATTYVPAGTFPSPAEDALAQRSISGLEWITDGEPLLSELGGDSSLFVDPASGGEMQNLITLSGSSEDVKNLFLIPTHGGTVHALAVASAVLLLAAFILLLLRKVDPWFPTVLSTAGSLLLLSEVLGTLPMDSSYQFIGATTQMMYLGLGGYTIFPLLMTALAIASSACAIISIRISDTPYFNNPIPRNKRLLAVSLSLAAGATLLLLTPVFQINLYTPGKINQANPTVVRPMSGAELLLFSKPDELMTPANNRGKALYGEAASKNGLTLADLQATVSTALNKISAMLWVTFLVTLAGTVLLVLRKRNKRRIVFFLLLAAGLQAVSLLVSTLLIPKDIGFVNGLAPVYISIGFSAFGAFFAGFLDYEELPKKFKLFLMMLPFLVAVFLFSYLPLSGWRYAFYNYKLGIPMDKQEYVGFQWFTSLWANPAQATETIRVLRNTFAMSGLGLATSWLPLVFAIFLTEIKTGWFKKFVQIFTTLPNFISWVLVFSFALTLFSLDTGVVNSMLLKLGWIQQPVAYLNSSEHIWLKMWLWNTWKTLGWSAIMYLAAIAGIDQELYEAAKVDGAGRWRQIWHITVPGILPTFFVLLLLSISNIVNNGMEQYLVFQNAMNKSTIEVLDLYVYNISLGTRSTNTISMATAIGILKSLVSIVLLFLANRFSKAVRGESIV